MKLTADNFHQIHGVPAPVPEFKFHSERRWRFDYAWPSVKLALEVEGGIFTGGRHINPVGFTKDMEKYNAAAVLGWRVVRCTPSTLLKTETSKLLRAALEASR